MLPTDPQKRITVNSLSNAELYDLYASAVYGNILTMVPQVPIAENILEKVFVHAFNNRVALTTSLRAPLTNLLNNSREKTYRTLRALEILRECCAGATVSIAHKK